MNRRGFFKLLGQAALLLAVAPTKLIPTPKPAAPDTLDPIIEIGEPLYPMEAPATLVHEALTLGPPAGIQCTPTIGGVVASVDKWNKFILMSFDRDGQVVEHEGGRLINILGDGSKEQA